MDRTHLGIYAAITSGNRILAIRKIKGPYMGTYDLPGGTPDFGETHEQTVCREVMEETECRMDFTQQDFCLATSFVYEYNIGRETCRLHHNAIVFHKEIDSSRIKLCTGDGIDSGGSIWVSQDDLGLSPLAKHVLLVKNRRNG